MEIDLSSFEQNVSENLLAKGLAYFKKNKVKQALRIDDKTFKVIIEGTEDYEIEYELTKDKVNIHYCSCPYDYGPICKHMVALFFTLTHFEEVVLMETTSKKKEKVTKSSVSKKIENLLDLLKEEELKNFLLKKINENKVFKNEFLAEFAYLTKKDEIIFFDDEIKAIIKSFTNNKHGFIYWNEVRELNKLLSNYLENAEKLIENKSYIHASNICFIILVEITKTLDFADDSNGDLGSLIDWAFGLLSEIVELEIENEANEYIFKTSTDLFKKGAFKGWVWHSGILELCASLNLDKNQFNEIIELLKNTKTDDFYAEEVLKIELKIYKKIKSELEIKTFMYDNIKYKSFREEILKDLISKKSYNDAIIIANEGVVLDEKNKPGLAKMWIDWLLKISILQKNKDEIIKYAKHLFIDGFLHEQDYFGILKNEIPNEKWNQFFNELIIEIKSKRHCDFYRVADLLVKENRMDELFNIIDNNSSIDFIVNFEKYLIPKYSKELVGFYEIRIYDYMIQNIGRTHYKYICKILRRISKLGFYDKTVEIKKHLSEKYKMRKALLEELASI